MTKQASTRNLIIFSLVTLASGWLGYALDRALGNPPEQQLGMLLWLIAPLLTALLLRAFGGDGWKDFGLRPAFRRNISWYLASVILQPLVLMAVVAFGLMRIADAASESWLLVLASALIPTLVKNVFEEFAWRGYLAPKVHALVTSRVAVHGIVGLVWAGWHLPYWLVFSGMAPLQTITGQNLMALTLSSFISVFAASVAYNELRFATGSVWPPLILHTAGNLLIDAVLIQGFIQIPAATAVLVLPVYQLLLSAAVLLVTRLRLGRAQQAMPVRFGA